MNKSKIKITLDIAVLTAGRVDLFEKCIDAILPQMEDGFKIHVFNNGFPSPEYERIYKKLPEGSAIRRTNSNVGFPNGANSAIRSGNAPMVLFITDDIFLHPGAITTLLYGMQQDESIGIMGYKLLFPEDSYESTRPAGKVQHIGMASNIRGEMIHPLIGWSPDNPKCNISRDVLAVTGATFMIRRAVFNKAGGFNPIYSRGYYEDMDLCFTIRSQGKRVFVNTNAVATHGVGQTFKNDTTPPPIQQNQMIFRSRWIGQMPWTEWEMF